MPSIHPAFPLFSARTLATALFCGLALSSGAAQAAGTFTLDGGNVLSDSVGANPDANSTLNGTGKVAIGTSDVAVTWTQTQTGLLEAPAALYDYGLLWGTGTSQAVFSPWVGDNTAARTPSFEYTLNFASGLNGLTLTDRAHWMSEYTTWTVSWTGASSSGTWSTNLSFPWTDAYVGSTATQVANGAFASGTAIRFDYDGTQGNNGLSNYNFSDWTLALPDNVTSVTLRADVNVPASTFISAIQNPSNRGHIGFEEVALNFDSAVLSPVTAPVPEPETYAMMLTGLGLMVLVARRRAHKRA